MSSCEKENFHLNAKEMGMILSEVFPEATRVQRRENGNRIWKYPLSKKSQPDEDALKWEDLPHFTKAFGWLLSSSDEKFFEWIKVQSQDLCQGNRILMVVKIFHDWTFTTSVNSRRVSNETITIVQLGSSKRLIRYLFDVPSKCSLCRGFSVPSKRIARDARGNTVGTTEEWLNGDDGSVSLHLRSIQCQVLLHDYKRSSSQLCEFCSRIKRNSSMTSAEEGAKPAAKKRESYMSEEELREKLSQEHNRRKNAERRLDYLKKKVEAEMKTFEAEDHKDFLHIFKGVKEETISEDMKVFWEVQQKALSQKSPTGYRWHPK